MYQVSCEMCNHAYFYQLFLLAAAHVMWSDFLKDLTTGHQSEIMGFFELKMAQALNVLKTQLHKVVHNMKVYNYSKGYEVTNATIDSFMINHNPISKLFENELETTTFLRECLYSVSRVEKIPGTLHVFVRLALAEIVWVQLFLPNNWQKPKRKRIPAIKNFLSNLDKDILSHAVRRMQNGGPDENIDSFVNNFNVVEFFCSDIKSFLKEIKIYSIKWWNVLCCYINMS